MNPLKSTDLAEVFFSALCDSKNVGYLVGRWADEREYEDLAEYQPHLTALAPEGVIVTGMVRRPFGCTFTAAGSSFRATFTTAGVAQCKRINPTHP